MLETILVWLIVGALGLVAVRRLWQTATGRGQCGGCAGSCRVPPPGAGCGGRDSGRGKPA
jgi:hypothetical protein